MFLDFREHILKVKHSMSLTKIFTKWSKCSLKMENRCSKANSLERNQ